MATFVWFIRPSLLAVKAAKEAPKRCNKEALKRCDAGSTKEVQHQRGAKPDQSGATSRMWIDGARPQAGEQPLASVDMTLQ